MCFHVPAGKSKVVGQPTELFRQCASLEKAIRSIANFIAANLSD